MHAMRRSIALVTLATLTTLAACGSDSTAPNANSDSIAGTWHLKSVNGSPLPFVIQSGATKVSLIADVVTVTDGGTWSESSTFSVVVNGGAPQQQVTADGGTWARAGAQVSFYSSSSGTSYATFNGNTGTMIDALGYTDVYQR